MTITYPHQHIYVNQYFKDKTKVNFLVPEEREAVKSWASTNCNLLLYCNCGSHQFSFLIKIIISTYFSLKVGPKFCHLVAIADFACTWKCAPTKVEAFVTDEIIDFFICLGGMIVGNHFYCKEKQILRRLQFLFMEIARNLEIVNT